MPQMLTRPSISVYELVSFGRQPYTGISGILSDSDYTKIDDAIRKTNLESLADSPCDRISGGELQRAYLAMVLAQDTPNLLLDEPAAHLVHLVPAERHLQREAGALFQTVVDDPPEPAEVLGQLHDERAFSVAARAPDDPHAAPGRPAD